MTGRTVARSTFWKVGVVDLIRSGLTAFASGVNGQASAMIYNHFYKMLTSSCRYQSNTGYAVSAYSYSCGGVLSVDLE